MPPTSSAHAKLTRASHLQEALARDLEVLGAAQSYTIVKDTDSATGYCRFRFSSVPVMPNDLDLRIGEVLYNYRCALDHLVWQLALSKGNQPDEHNEFPIFNNADKYEKAKVIKLHGLSPDAIAVIDRFQPFQCVLPNDYWWYLWYLYRLSNADKHRQLLFTRRHISTLAVGWFSDGTVKPPIVSRLRGQVDPDQEIVSVLDTTGMNDLTVRPRILVCFSDPPADIRTDMPVHNIMGLIDTAVHEVFARLDGYLG